MKEMLVVIILTGIFSFFIMFQMKELPVKYYNLFEDDGK